MLRRSKHFLAEMCKLLSASTNLVLSHGFRTRLACYAPCSVCGTRTVKIIKRKNTHISFQEDL